jgi:hypothetical protein
LCARGSSRNAGARAGAGADAESVRQFCVG